MIVSLGLSNDPTDELSLKNIEAMSSGGSRMECDASNINNCEIYSEGKLEGRGTGKLIKDGVPSGGGQGDGGGKGAN